MKQFQLHWQNPANPDETKLVAQASAFDGTSCDKMLETFKNVIERRKADCPHGWGPLVCDETCDLFVRETKR